MGGQGEMRFLLTLTASAAPVGSATVTDDGAFAVQACERVVAVRARAVAE